MSWHRVIIKHSDEAHLFAQGLMIPFMQRYKEAGTPEGVAVYINRDDLGNRIYYFSSHASALANDLLHTFHATRCLAEPHLERFRKNSSLRFSLWTLFLRRSSWRKGSIRVRILLGSRWLLLR